MIGAIAACVAGLVALLAWAAGGASDRGPIGVGDRSHRNRFGDEDVRSASAPPVERAVVAEIPLAIEPGSDTFAATAYVTGVVFDADTTLPVGNARVTVDRPLRPSVYLPEHDGFPRDRERASTVTSSDGHFSVHAAPDVALELTVRAAGYGVVRTDFVFAGERVVVPLHVSATLMGRVTRAATGAPVEGARVRGWMIEHEVELDLFRVETDAGGNYRVEDLAPGVFKLSVVPSHLLGVPWRTLELVAGEVRHFDVALEEGATIRGTVSDSQTGAPISNAEVIDPWRLEASVRSDASGAFEIEGCRSSSLTIRAEGYADFRGRRRRDSSSPATFALDARLVPGRVAVGRVVDEEGHSIANADVVVSTDRGGNDRDWKSTRTASDGSFRVADLAPTHTHTVRLSAVGHARRTLAFPSDESSSPIPLGDLVLGPPATIRGSVVATDGDPIPNSRVLLSGAGEGSRSLRGEDQSLAEHGVHFVTYTDGRGRFRFLDVGPDTYGLSADISGSKESLWLNVEAGASIDDIVLEVDRGRSIRGRVETPEGIGVAGVWLRASREDGHRFGGATSAAGGAFEIIGLPNEEVVVACGLGQDADPRTLARLGPARPLRVSPGEENVRVVLRPLDVLRGRVIDGKGNPAANIRVRATDPDREIRDQMTFSDSDGRFEFALPRGVAVTLIAGVYRYDPEERKNVKMRRPPLRLEGVRSDAQNVVFAPQRRGG